MSNRRKIGEVVFRKEDGVRQEFMVELVYHDPDMSVCMIDCGDPECKEYDVRVLGTDMMIYYVSECEMEDLKRVWSGKDVES